mgnify:CR=1 FL=1
MKDRIVCGAKRGTSHSAIYDELKWPKLDERRKENKLKFIHRIINNVAPSYLIDLLPLPDENNPYNLRNNDQQKQFRFRTTKFQKSLLPDSIAMWNKLDSASKTIQNTDCFKKSISPITSSNPLFYGHTRFLNLIHSQLRMGCSNLKAHLYQLHVVDSPQCQCNMDVEDSFHYLFMCPLYHVERIRLFHNVRQLCDVTIDVLLFGNYSLDVDKNLELFKYVENYIHETERFV